MQHRMIFGFCALLIGLCFLTSSAQAINNKERAWKIYWQLRSMVPSHEQTDEAISQTPQDESLPMLLPPPGSSPLDLIADLDGMRTWDLRNQVLIWLKDQAQTHSSIDVGAFTAPMKTNIPSLGGINSLLPVTTQLPKLDELLDVLQSSHKGAIKENPTSPDLLLALITPVILYRPVCFITMYYRETDTIDPDSNQNGSASVTEEGEIPLTKIHKQGSGPAKNLEPHIEILVVDVNLETYSLPFTSATKRLASLEQRPLFIGHVAGYAFGVKTPELPMGGTESVEFRRKHINTALSVFQELKNQLSQEFLLESGLELQHSPLLVDQDSATSNSKSRLLIVPESAISYASKNEAPDSGLKPETAYMSTDIRSSIKALKKQTFVELGPASIAISETEVHKVEGTAITLTEAEKAQTHQPGLWRVTVEGDDPLFGVDRRYQRILSTSILMTSSVPDISALQLCPEGTLDKIIDRRLFQSNAQLQKIYTALDALLAHKTSSIALPEWETIVPTIPNHYEKLCKNSDILKHIPGGKNTLTQLFNMVLNHPLYLVFNPECNDLASHIKLVRQLASWRVMTKHRLQEPTPVTTEVWLMPDIAANFPHMWDEAKRTRSEEELLPILATILSNIKDWAKSCIKNYLTLPSAEVIPAAVEQFAAFLYRTDVNPHLSRIIKRENPLTGLADELILALQDLKVSIGDEQQPSEDIEALLHTIPPEKKIKVLTALLGNSGAETIFTKIKKEESLPQLTWNMQKKIYAALPAGHNSHLPYGQQTQALLGISTGKDTVDFTQLRASSSFQSKQVCIESGGTQIHLTNTRLMSGIMTGTVSLHSLLMADDPSPNALLPYWNQEMAGVPDDCKVSKICRNLPIPSLPPPVKPLALPGSNPIHLLTNYRSPNKS